MVGRMLIFAIALSGVSIVHVPAFAQGKGKCTKPQAICAVENGGRCNPRTGGWGIGGRYGGSRTGYLDCLHKIYSGQRKA
jgi:hypothetical protein